MKKAEFLKLTIPLREYFSGEKLVDGYYAAVKITHVWVSMGKPYLLIEAIPIGEGIEGEESPISRGTDA